MHILLDVLPRRDVDHILERNLYSNGRAVVVYGMQEEDSSGDHEDEGHERHAGHGEARDDGNGYHARYALVIG